MSAVQEFVGADACVRLARLANLASSSGDEREETYGASSPTDAESESVSPPTPVRMRRVRVLVYIHVDWGWIWQRPHALPDALAKQPGFDVLVTYQRSFRRKQLIRNQAAVRHLPLPRVPFGRFRLVRVLNSALGAAFLTAIGRLWRPEVVLVTHPRLFDSVAQLASDALLIYDCMDVATGFEMPENEKREIADLEVRLIAAADVIVTSSEHLKKRIRAVATPAKRVVVVRNGFEWQSSGHVVPNPEVATRVRLDYFGTVGPWMDFELLLALVERDPDVELHLWGPTQVAPPGHQRIVVHGPVEHNRLAAAVAGATALIMPFVVDDLTLGVDPVKLYEYIALGLPAISVYYQELTHFNGLVTFYSGLEELLSVVQRLRSDPKALLPDRADREVFLAQSTWSKRSEELATVIREGLSQE